MTGPRRAPSPTYAFKAKVRRWVDGDTVDLEVSLPFGTSLGNFRKPARFRLWGIDAPERSAGAMATDYVRRAAPEGSTVTIESILPPLVKDEDPDSFGRWFCEIWGPDGTHLNQELLDRGLAVPYTR